jgi:CBS domain-containing protein
VKHGGITIVGNLARSYAIGAGLVEKRTIPRLRAAAEAGAIEDELAAGLEEAFRFLWGVRLEHQVRRIRAGEPADDFVDPAELGPITRHGLKEAFRAIARAQRLLASDLGVTQR